MVSYEYGYFFVVFSQSGTFPPRLLYLVLDLFLHTPLGKTSLGMPMERRKGEYFAPEEYYFFVVFSQSGTFPPRLLYLVLDLFLHTPLGKTSLGMPMERRKGEYFAPEEVTKK